MAEAASLFVGTHDFRNVCKMDVAAVHSFQRTILSFTLQPEDAAGEVAVTSPGESLQRQPPAAAAPDGAQSCSAARLWSLNIRGTAFLWHQVRCMAALLFLVGRRLEAPSVVTTLLTVSTLPSRPAYDMAPEEPLLFFGCGYEAARAPGAPMLQPQAGPTPIRSLVLLREHLLAQARQAAVRARVFHLALRHCEGEGGSDWGGEGKGRPARHVPLLQRKREATYEEQIARRGMASKLRPADDMGE